MNIKYCNIIIAVVIILMNGCSSSPELYCSSGEENDLVDLLKKEKFNIHQYTQPEQALETAPRNSVVLLLSKEYPKTVQVLSGKMQQIINEKNLKVYTEFASLSDNVHVPKEIKLERVVVTDSLNPELLPMDLLTINKSFYCPMQADNPALVIAKVAGFNKAVYGLKDTPSYPLLYKTSGNMWMATSKLSGFASARFIPEKKWKSVWEFILSDFLGKSIKFKEWPTFIKPAYGENEILSKSARIESIQKGTEWFFNGHFLVHPSWEKTWLDKYQSNPFAPFGPELPANAADGDGSLGMLEGHLSAVYADGRQMYRYWLRNDVQGESSMAFAITGEVLNKPEYKTIAKNLIDFAFDTFRDGSRNDPKSDDFGLLGWGIGRKNIYYGDDNARAFLGMALGADILKNGKWNKKLVENALANFRTSGKYGFRKRALNSDELNNKGWKNVHKEELINPHPHHQAWLWSCFLWLYDKTGFEDLLSVT